jgi:hypothetical protein
MLFSFKERKKTVDFQRYIRRIIDLTIPNKTDSGNLPRYENRYNRSVPVLLCPWKDDEPLLSETIVAITKDIADRGIGIILTQPFAAETMVLGFCLDEVTALEPWFFLGVRRHNIAIGGDFWLLGIELTEFISETCREQLEPLIPLVQKLYPPAR